MVRIWSRTLVAVRQVVLPLYCEPGVAEHMGKGIVGQ